MAHGQVLQDALFGFFQSIVVGVQDALGFCNIQLIACFFVPREFHEPVQIGARYGVFGRGFGHARHAFQFALGFCFCFFGHAGGFDHFAQFFNFGTDILSFAQFILNCPQLLTQKIFFLCIFHGSRGFRADFFPQFQNFNFAI